MHFPPENVLDWGVELILIPMAVWFFFMRTLPGRILWWIIATLMGGITMLTWLVARALAHRPKQGESS